MKFIRVKNAEQIYRPLQFSGKGDPVIEFLCFR